MAGRTGRSGSKEWTDFAPSSEAPNLDGTIESNLAFCAWIAREKSAGRIDSRDADSMAGIARVEITGIRARFSEREMQELRSLVDRQEKAIAKLTKAEQEARYASGSSTSTVAISGRVRVSPDGDPH